MEKQSIIKYTIWGLDVWGHSSTPASLTGCGCVAITQDPETGEQHDDGNCRREGYTVNDRCGIGELEVTTDEGGCWNTTPEDRRNGYMFESWSVSDEALLKALQEQGYIKDSVEVAGLTYEGEEDGTICINDSYDGRPILQLEFVSATEVTSCLEEDCIADCHAKITASQKRILELSGAPSERRTKGV